MNDQVKQIRDKVEVLFNSTRRRNTVGNAAINTVCEDILSFIDKIQQESIPKHGYIEKLYHCGSEPRWKVGDTIAIYNFYRDYEGEEVLGEITEVVMDENYEDWTYHFKDGETISEYELIAEEAYRKN